MGQEDLDIPILSHELRGPLAQVNQAVSLIYDEVPGRLNRRQKEILSSTKNNLERLNKTIDELLDLSRIEGKKFSLHYSLVNLNDLIKDSAEFFKRVAQEKGIELKYVLPQTQVNIFLDFEKINRVIANLINNAIKFTPSEKNPLTGFTQPGGKITVELETLESKARIAVIDTGVGIIREDLPKLFRKFSQLSKIKEKGLGLGLFIVKNIVEKHSGEVWVESKSGKGSRFYFTLPLLYTTSDLNQENKEKINQCLAKEIPLYLINLLIVNYQHFKKKIKIGPQQLFKNLLEIIEKLLKDFSREKLKKPQLVFVSNKYRECSIIYPYASQRDVIKLCKTLKNRILAYSAKIVTGSIFMNIGILSYNRETKFSSKPRHRVAANLEIRKVYIGLELRRFKRINYQADIEVAYPQNLKRSSQIIDISTGGLCFLSSQPLETDTKIKIKLRLTPQKEPLGLLGRVAWIKKIEELSGGKMNKYRVGLEFVALSKVDKEKIDSFIKNEK